MPLGTLDRSAPPLFNQGPSALSKLVLLSALALFLMVADARFHVVQPLRAVLGSALYPVQWLAMKPVQAFEGAAQYFTDLQDAQRTAQEARRALALQSERAGQADALAQENARLRAMLDLRQSVATPGRVAEVLYDAADPYRRKIVIDQGLAAGIAPGSPVIDARGVLGQVTNVLALTSEVTLVSDRDLSVPVQNMRTGARSVVFGDASAHSAGMELRFTQANADVHEGDLLATSGVDGVYPAGLAVARVARIERRADSGYARIYCEPVAQVTAARFVMVLAPVGEPQASAPVVADEPAPRPGAQPSRQAKPTTEAQAARAARAARKPPRRTERAP